MACGWENRPEELGLSPADIPLPSGAMDSPEEFEDLLETLKPSAADDSDEMPRLFHQATIAREKKEEITRLAQSAAAKARELADIKLKALAVLDGAVQRTAGMLPFCPLLPPTASRVFSK